MMHTTLSQCGDPMPCYHRLCLHRLPGLLVLSSRAGCSVCSCHCFQQSYSLRLFLGLGPNRSPKLLCQLLPRPTQPAAEYISFLQPGQRQVSGETPQVALPPSSVGGRLVPEGFCLLLVLPPSTPASTRHFVGFHETAVVWRRRPGSRWPYGFVYSAACLPNKKDNPPRC